MGGSKVRGRTGIYLPTPFQALNPASKKTGSNLAARSFRETCFSAMWKNGGVENKERILRVRHPYKTRGIPATQGAENQHERQGSSRLLHLS
jgi:hypothetical protein